MRLRSGKDPNPKSPEREVPPQRNPSPRQNLQQTQNDKQQAFDIVYSDLQHPGAFSRKIVKYLRKNKTHSLHKPQRKNFKRRRIITRYPGHIVEMDLVDMRKYAGSNSGYHYILVVIDLFSKKLWLRGLKTKEGKETADAIRTVIDDMGFPVQTVIFDEGKEFENKDVGILFSQFSIHSYNILTKTKAGGVERVNRTIKNIIFKIFTQTGNKRWIDSLEDIQHSYNNTWHSVIKMAPNKVTWHNRKKVFKNMYRDINDTFDCRLKRGDTVRIALNKGIFSKGYKINWSKDLFTIVKVFQRAGVCWYRLKDTTGDIYPRGKYFFQLNKV